MAAKKAAAKKTAAASPAKPKKESARAGYLRAHYASAGRQLTSPATLADIVEAAEVHGARDPEATPAAAPEPPPAQ